MVCIIGVGIYLSIRTRFVQVRKFGASIKGTIGKLFDKKNAADGSITPFQAVCTALAGTIGTGNIAGVAGAIFGVSRGIFSNEAGLGTGSIAHACSDTDNPVKQGMFGIFEVFADTIVVCTLTALVILSSGITVNYGTAAGAICCFAF